MIVLLAAGLTWTRRARVALRQLFWGCIAVVGFLLTAILNRAWVFFILSLYFDGYIPEHLLALVVEFLYGLFLTCHRVLVEEWMIERLLT